MPGDDAFQVEGMIVEVLPNGVYRAELANGHRLLAFVPGKLKTVCNRLAVGDRVRLQLSSYDLSQGRILVEKGSLSQL
jgi:translation initiation factor IF-1